MITLELMEIKIQLNEPIEAKELEKTIEKLKHQNMCLYCENRKITSIV